jgi:virulence-associated protein VagC
MPEHLIAILFEDRGHQAVRLPRDFQFSSGRVRVRRFGNGVLLERFFSNTEEWFAAMDKFGREPFRVEGRAQPPTSD